MPIRSGFEFSKRVFEIFKEDEESGDSRGEEASDGDEEEFFLAAREAVMGPMARHGSNCAESHRLGATPEEHSSSGKEANRCRRMRER